MGVDSDDARRVRRGSEATPEDLPRQLAKLKAFYEDGIDQVGWRAYTKVDLRFGDQIVCTKK